MKNVKEFFLLLFILLRLPFVWLFTKVLRLVPKIEGIKQWFVIRYWKWKFPYIRQMRKLVGAEHAWAVDQIDKIRSQAHTILTDHQRSNSSKKKIKAKVFNEEKAFMERHKLTIFHGQLYKME